MARVLNSLLLWAACASGGFHWPRMGHNEGANRIAWTPGCCEGDLVIVEFRDENGDGNQGSGLLRLENASDGSTNTYNIGPFWDLWSTFGPYCAPAGEHSLTFTSDAEVIETTYRVIDSFGLVRAHGGMMDFPAKFNTTAPAKFCTPADHGAGQDGIMNETLRKERARKLLAAHRQWVPRETLEREGLPVPFDEGLSALKPP